MEEEATGGWGVGAGGWDWGEVMLQQWHLMEEPGSQAPQHQIAERHQPWELQQLAGAVERRAWGCWIGAERHVDLNGEHHHAYEPFQVGETARCPRATKLACPETCTSGRTLTSLTPADLMGPMQLTSAMDCLGMPACLTSRS